MNLSKQNETPLAGNEKRISQFAKNTGITFITGLMGFVLTVGTSVILARYLGPEGRGKYALVFILPSLLMNLTGLGIGPATIFHTARGRFSNQEVLGGSLVVASLVSGLGLGVGLLCILFFRESIVPGIAGRYLAAGLVLIPLSRFFLVGRSVLFGKKHFFAYNLISVFQNLLSLLLIALVLISFGWGVGSVVVVRLGAALTALVVLLFLVRRLVSRQVAPSVQYVRAIAKYGSKAFLGNIIGFLNYRIDVLILNAFLNPLAVGYYSIAVGLAERLWILSKAASAVLFPTVASEENEGEHSLTPLVSRTVLVVTSIGAILLFAVSRWAISLLYSADYLPSVPALRVLLVGIVSLSVGRVLSNDLAGRGRIMLNNYVGAAALVTNITLNIILIPKFELLGAAWATAISYTVAFGIQASLYCYVSGNSFADIVVPQRNDLKLYAGLIVRGWIYVKKLALKIRPGTD